MGTLFLQLGLGAALIAVYVINKILGASKNAGRPPLPPGPKGLPVVGNVNDLPKPGDFEAHHWIKHKERYGWFSFLASDHAN